MTDVRSENKKKKMKNKIKEKLLEEKKKSFGVFFNLLIYLK